jgi:hypothetical protein
MVALCMEMVKSFEAMRHQISTEVSAVSSYVSTLKNDLKHHISVVKNDVSQLQQY